MTETTATERTEAQYIQIIKSIPEFSLLDPEHLKKIASIVGIKTYPAGSIVFRENDVGDAFYIILSGEIRTYAANEEDVEVQLMALYAMDSLGEIGFITGHPRSASAKTVIDSELLVIKKNDFDDVLEHEPSLTKTFINILGHRLKTDNERAIEQSNKEHELKQFWVEKGAREPIALVGRSKHIQELKEFALKSADNNIPVFLIGEKGTGKLARAQHIFQNSRRRQERYLTVDCASIRQVSGDGSANEGQRRNDILLGLSQESTLFGHLKDSLPFAKTRRLGYIEVAEGGTIVIDNVEKLTPGVQNKLLMYLKTGLYMRIGSSEQIKSDVKMIFTADVGIEGLVNGGRFNRELYKLLMRQSIFLVPLRDRQRDIHDLADHFVETFCKIEQKDGLKISKEAMHSLLEYDWPNNIDQLKGVIRRAVSLAEGDEIVESQIFLGPVTTEKARGLNVLKLGFLRRFVEGRLFPDTITNIISVIYIAVILSLLFGFGGYDRKVVLLVWAIGWPVMLMCAPFASRIFCGLCPMRAIGGKVQRKCGLRLKLPELIKSYGPYVGVVGFAFILSVEHIVDMPNDPASTVVLLLSILGFAVIFSFLFKRAAWCRYICPLGQMNGVFSKLAVVEVRANTSVCNAECRVPTCYNGTDANNGCPMSLGVFNIRTNENCIVCGQCVKNCQHKSVRFNLRLPAAELVRDSGFDSYRKGANLAIAFLVPALIAGVLAMNFAKLSIYRQLSIGVDNKVLHYAMFYIFFYLLTLGLIWGVAVRFTEVGGKDSTAVRFVWYACSFIPIAFAGEIANQIITFINGFGQIVPEVYLQLASHRLVMLNHQESTGVVEMAQASLVVAGTAASIYCGRRVIDKITSGKGDGKYWPVYIVNVSLLVLFMSVFILRR